MLLDPDEFDQSNAHVILRWLCDRIGTRVDGSAAEAAAAEYIAGQLTNAGYTNTTTSNYLCFYFSGGSATLKVLPDGETIHGIPGWMSKTTPETGIEYEGLYCGLFYKAGDIPSSRLQDKIGFFLLRNDRMKEIKEGMEAVT